MSRTYAIAEMKFIDVTALSDAFLSSNDNLTTGNLELFAGQTEQKNYGTLELNQFVLDGSKEIFPTAPDDIAFWSSKKSLSDGSFESNPVIEISFTGPHTSSGLTLYFVEEHPAEILMTWYDCTGTKIISKTFYPDKLVYVCKYQVENFGKIRIEFVKTWFPERYIKLQYILYGRYIVWENDLIQTAKIQEEIDQTSATLSINTADISIVDENNDFDIGNEEGDWKSIQKTQQVSLTEYKDGLMIPVGMFYIDGFSFAENIASFSMIDAIGLMDKYTFYDGKVYVNILAGIILEEIFATAGIIDYFIDEEIYNTLLSGYLAIQTCRAALQMICFACGAVADDSRSNTVRVYKPDRYVKATIGTDRKFAGNSKVQLHEYVSGVAITCNKYVLESEDTEIYSDVLSAGTTRITFTEPYQPESIKVSVGTIAAVKTNYMDVTMGEAGECVITGRKYASSEFSYQKNVKMIEAGETENIKSYGTCTLHNSAILSDIADRLLSYHSLRKKVDMKYLLDVEQVGNWVNIKDVKGIYATTLIESQSIDLTGGFIAVAACRGYSKVLHEEIFINEIYVNEEIGVL